MGKIIPANLADMQREGLKSKGIATGPQQVEIPGEVALALKAQGAAEVLAQMVGPCTQLEAATGLAYYAQRKGAANRLTLAGHAMTLAAQVSRATRDTYARTCEMAKAAGLPVPVVMRNKEEAPDQAPQEAQGEAIEPETSTDTSKGEIEPGSGSCGSEGEE